MPSIAEADDAVVTLLDAITTPVALDAGRNLFLGPPLDPDAARPTQAVFVECIGEENSRFCGTASDWRKTRVRVSCRADRSDYAGNQALVRAVRDALLAPTVSGYTSVAVAEGPYFARLDRVGRSIWTLVAVLQRAT